MPTELDEIKALLLHEWDPIGVSNIPEAFDEYDSYAFELLTMLAKGDDLQTLAKYLDWAVTYHMGLPKPANSLEIAAKLAAAHTARAHT